MMNAGVTSEIVAASPSAGPAATKRKPAARKPAGRKTASRFRKFAGGEESEELAAAASGDVTTTQANGDADSGGITAALVGLAAADGQTVVQVPVLQTAPHPFNDPDRSKPQTGDPKWMNWSMEPGQMASRFQRCW